MSKRSTRQYSNSFISEAVTLVATGDRSLKGVAESFFKTLKREVVELSKQNNISKTKTLIFEYIESYYNRKRKHSGLGYNTPNQLEELYC